ncbi:MAG: hypothetical protein Kow0090_05450 [Myxococcota bacterium]
MFKSGGLTAWMLFMALISAKPSFGGESPLYILLDLTAAGQIDDAVLTNVMQTSFPNTPIYLTKFERSFAESKRTLAKAFEETALHSPTSDIAALYFEREKFVIAILRSGENEVAGRLWDISKYAESESVEKFAALAVKSSLVKIPWRYEEKAGEKSEQRSEESPSVTLFTLKLSLKSGEKASAPQNEPLEEGEKLIEDSGEPKQEELTERATEPTEKPLAGEKRRFIMSLEPSFGARFQPGWGDFAYEFTGGAAFFTADKLFYAVAAAGYCLNKKYTGETDYSLSARRLPLYFEGGGAILDDIFRLSVGIKNGWELLLVQSDEKLKNGVSETILEPFFSGVQRLFWSPLKQGYLFLFLEERYFIRRQDFVMGLSNGGSERLYRSERWEFLGGVGFGVELWRN